MHSAPVPSSTEYFSFLEWHMISAKNLYCFFELRFGAFVFTCSRRDDRLRSHYETSKPAPIFSQRH